MKQDLISSISRQKLLPDRETNHVWRAAAATLKAHVSKTPLLEMAKSMYPDDPVTPLILQKAAVTQATLTDAAWAGPLARYAVEQSIEDIVSLSVAGKLEDAGALRINMGRLASVTVPGRSISAADAGQWVQEGYPIPVRQYNFPNAKLQLQKLAVIVTMTREITEASNIEDVLRILLTDAAGMALDNALFSTSAATAAQPAGLLHGLTPLTAAPAGGSAFEACGQDMGTLVQDIATRGGGRKAYFVAPPKQGVSIRFWAGGQFDITPSGTQLPVATSVGMPVASLAAIEPESLAFAINNPEFSVSDCAAVQQEDTAPGTLMTGPTKSMYQIEGFALKMILWASWAMRAPHASYMTGVNW
jgi:hypothetical protein